MTTGLSSLFIADFKIKEYLLYSSLVHSLNKDNGWERVLSTLLNKGIEISPISVLRMRNSLSPADILIQELENRYAKVSHLSELLKQSSLTDAFILIAEYEPVKIVKQPGEQDEEHLVKEGQTLELECTAEGMPLPAYQWYIDNVEIPDHTSPKLVIEYFIEEYCGEYYCRVTQKASDNCPAVEVVSNSVLVDLHPEPPVFKVNLPDTVSVKAGTDVILSVTVQSRPPPTEFQWIFGNTILDGQAGDSLVINNVSVNDEGDYRCTVKNDYGEVCSTPCKIKVYAPPVGNNEKNEASMKVALLIGNSEYHNLNKLTTPANDLVDLKKILTKLGFVVIALRNLSLVEMVNAVKYFCKILPPNAYALFYFVGHGFRLAYRYMMPVDCPPTDQYTVADCYCLEALEKELMETRVQLAVVVLDMCLKVPKGNPNLERTVELPCEYVRNDKRSILQCFATSSHLESYENPDKRNGVYFTHLSKFLDKDIPVTQVFDHTTIDLMDNQDPSARTRQKPHILYDDAQRFSLTDHVKGDERAFTRTAMIFNLPAKKILRFRSLGISATVRILPNELTFINVVDIIFPAVLSQWQLKVEINAVEIENLEWKESGGKRTLTLYDLQKAKNDLHISVHLLTVADGSRIVVDNCIMDLGKLLIIPAALWFKRQETEEDAGPSTS